MKLLNNKKTKEEFHSEMEELLQKQNELLNMIVVRQYPIGIYKADFYYPQYKIVLEVDGSKYHSQDVDFFHDRDRDLYMTNLGYKIIRVSGSIVYKNAFGIVQCIPIIGWRKIYFINSDGDLRAIQLESLERNEFTSSIKQI